MKYSIVTVWCHVTLHIMKCNIIIWGIIICNMKFKKCDISASICRRHTGDRLVFWLTCRSDCTWKAWRRYVCGSASSTRHFSRTAIHSLPMSTCTASPLIRTHKQTHTHLIKNALSSSWGLEISDSVQPAI